MLLFNIEPLCRDYMYVVAILIKLLQSSAFYMEKSFISLIIASWGLNPVSLSHYHHFV